MAVEIPREVVNTSTEFVSFPFSGNVRPRFEVQLMDDLRKLHPGRIQPTSRSRGEGIVVLDGEYYRYSTKCGSHSETHYRNLTLADAGETRWTSGGVVVEETDRNGLLVIDSSEILAESWTINANISGNRRGVLIDEAFDWLQENLKSISI